MTTTFETAKVGDRVWSLEFGWGKISKINDCSSYPIDVEFDNGGFIMFTLDGRLYKGHVTQSLFWDEVVIEAPNKPLPDLPDMSVDTKVVVWDNAERKYNRYFSRFEKGKLLVYEGGATSWSGERTESWENWELVE